MMTSRLLVLLPALFWVDVWAASELTGDHLMRASQERHQRFPYVFQRVDLITQDRQGRQSVRQARRYWRVDSGSALSFLWVFEQPPELRGVAILARVDEQQQSSGLYLPAHGPVLKRGSQNQGSNDLSAMNILGTDFSIRDLSPEDVKAYRYRRLGDVQIGETVYYQLLAQARVAGTGRKTGVAERRLLLRRDTLFIERVDYLDDQGRLIKRLTHHDLKPFQGESWRAGMSLMVDYASGHQTLIKVRERVDSRDYVPSSLFTEQALFSGRHLLSPQEWALAGKSPKLSGSAGGGK